MIFTCQSGSTVDFSSIDAIRKSRVTLDDIARGLSRINRFAGQTKAPVTVAQHSLIVANLMFNRYKSSTASLIGLLHDAHEAFTSDVPLPTKALLAQLDTAPSALGLKPLKMIESALDAMIDASLGTTFLRVFVYDLKAADEKARRIEWAFAQAGVCCEYISSALSPAEAEAAFKGYFMADFALVSAQQTGYASPISIDANDWLWIKSEITERTGLPVKRGFAQILSSYDGMKSVEKDQRARIEAAVKALQGTAQ